MSNGLSYFVDDEINRLRLDDSFAHMNQEIFSKISEHVHSFESDSFEIYRDEDLDSIHHTLVKDKEEQIIKENPQFKDFSNEPKFFLSVNETPAIIAPSSIQNKEKPEAKIESKVEHRPNHESKTINESFSIKSKNEKENKESLKIKNKGNRSIIPEEFLSLKRKDVIMKSIFRMMRRHYCKLLEDVTGYNRKEK